METRPAVIVTGASSGIGREIARLAARDGLFVLLVARSREALATLAAEIEAAGGHAGFVADDLADPDSGDALAAALLARGLHCEILVNNAGYGAWGSLAESDRLIQLGMIDVNVRAVADLTLRFLPGMVSRGSGRILNVGSTSAYLPTPYMATYSATKAFVRAFSLAIGEELAGSGVTVTFLSPGVVKTGFALRAGVDTHPLYTRTAFLSAATVARIGWAAMKRGRRVVTPGVTAWAQSYLLPPVPNWLKIPAAARLQRRLSRR